MKNFPKVFIIILNYNGQDVIKKCLASVFKNEYADFEVVVVDNNSTDGSLEAAKNNFSKAHFIKNEANLGFSAGNNVGIRFALERMAKYVLLLNNDTEVEKDFLEKLVAVAEEKLRVSAFGFRVADFIHPPALLLFLGPPGIEDHAIAGLEGGFQTHHDRLAPHAGHFAEIHAAFLAEPRMDEFLVVDATEPAGVKAAAERHLHRIPIATCVG